jgi:hypothetical protein
MCETDGILTKQTNRVESKCCERAQWGGRRNRYDGNEFSNERQEAVSVDKRFLLSDRMCMLKSIHHNEVVQKRSMA